MFVRAIIYMGVYKEPRIDIYWNDMDNASIHHRERIPQMCCNAGVEFVYLPPHCLDLSPTKESFAEAFIKQDLGEECVSRWEIF